jgi:hypothetical protein
MTTIFRTCLLVLLFISNSYLSSEEYKFNLIGSDLSITDLEANAKTLLFTRSIAWKSFNLDITNKKKSLLYKACWEKYLLNKKVEFTITNSILSLDQVKSNSVDYKYTYDPKMIKISNINESSFIQFCNFNEEIQDNKSYESSIISFDLDDI